MPFHLCAVGNVDNDSLRCETKERKGFSKEKLCESAFESDSVLEGPCLDFFLVSVAATSSLQSWQPCLCHILFLMVSSQYCLTEMRPYN